jgi:hypothetical protein
MAQKTREDTFPKCKLPFRPYIGKSFWCICNQIAKTQHLLPVQCLSVHDPHLTTKAPLDWFPWNWCWVLLLFEIFQLQLKMKSTKRHSTWKSVLASVSTLGLTCTKIFWKNVAKRKQTCILMPKGLLHESHSFNDNYRDFCAAISQREIW